MFVRLYIISIIEIIVNSKKNISTKKTKYYNVDIEYRCRFCLVEESNCSINNRKEKKRRAQEEKKITFFRH